MLPSYHTCPFCDYHVSAYFEPYVVFNHVEVAHPDVLAEIAQAARAYEPEREAEQ